MNFLKTFNKISKKYIKSFDHLKSIEEEMNVMKNELDLEINDMKNELDLELEAFDLEMKDMKDEIDLELESFDLEMSQMKDELELELELELEDFVRYDESNMELDEKSHINVESDDFNKDESGCLVPIKLEKIN